MHACMQGLAVVTHLSSLGAARRVLLAIIIIVLLLRIGVLPLFLSTSSLFTFLSLLRQVTSLLLLASESRPRWQHQAGARCSSSLAELLGWSSLSFFFQL
ncbi:hypothetical protein V8E36_001969 [Tilletia maclaganii]